MIFDGRTVQSTPESGADAGYDGHKRRKGRKVHTAVDTLGHLLALVVTPANEQERAQVADLAATVQAVTGETVELKWGHAGSWMCSPAALRRRSSTDRPGRATSPFGITSGIWPSPTTLRAAR